MRYTTRTEYGLICMIYMAKHTAADRVTIREIAAQENYPIAYLEKILQHLRQANLLVSHQGNQGGYTLARPASEITLKQVIEALEGSTFDIFCAPEIREDIVCTHICMCGVKPVWKRTRELLDHFFDSITLETLAKNQAEVQNLIPAAR